MPLFYGTVNQLLINRVQFIRDVLLEFVNTGNLAIINPVLHDRPDFVIHQIQIWAILRPQIWTHKVMCAPKCLVFCKIELNVYLHQKTALL